MDVLWLIWFALSITIIISFLNAFPILEKGECEWFLPEMSMQL